MDSELPYLYALLVSYRGTRFHGFQSQPSKNTIQDQLEACLETFLRHPVRIAGASRTDSGVHAEGQVCTFRSSRDIDPRRLLRSCSAILPGDIVVMKAWRPASDFHPIGSAVGKIYCYRIWTQDAIPPTMQQIVWKVPWNLDLKRLSEQLRDCCGTHNFRAFCASDASVKSFDRKIIAAEVIVRGPLVEIWFHGEGFLKQMIRSLVGSLVDLSSENHRIDDMRALIAGQDRSRVGRTAPALGLTLVKVQYNPEHLASFLNNLECLYALPLNQIISDH